VSAAFLFGWKGFDPIKKTSESNKASEVFTYEYFNPEN